jgi:hypothetical protein
LGLAGYIDWLSVHDYFKEKDLLQDSNFFGMHGNNILDENFINNEVIPTFANHVEGVPMHKSGAILTFKNHLISII